MAESRAVWVKRVSALVADLARAEAKLEKASLARMHLPSGSSRARVTTANANHARAAEHRDRVQERLEALGVTVPYAAPLHCTRCEAGSYSSSQPCRCGCHTEATR